MPTAVKKSNGCAYVLNLCSCVSYWIHLGRRGSGSSCMSLLVIFKSVKSCSAFKQSRKRHIVGLWQDNIDLNPLCQPSARLVLRGRSISVEVPQIQRKKGIGCRRPYPCSLVIGNKLQHVIWNQGLQ